MMAEGIAHGAASARERALHAPSASRWTWDKYEYGRRQVLTAFALIERLADGRRIARHHFQRLESLRTFARAHGIEVDTE